MNGPNQMSSLKKQDGFNLLELMVVLLVAGILMTVGVPAFNGVIDNSRMSTAANDVVLTLHVARTEAIKRRANVSVCPSTEWDSDVPNCTATDMADGWIVFVDSFPPALHDLAHTGAPDILYVHGPMPDGVNLTVADANNLLGNDPFLAFSSNGFPVATLAGNNAAFNFQLCDQRGNANAGGGVAAGRWVRVLPTGRPQLYRDQAQVQSANNPTNGC